MTLEQALHILASIHTRDNDETGFVVIAGATIHNAPLFSWSQSDYIEAWRVVRDAVHMQTAPAAPTIAARKP